MSPENRRRSIRVDLQIIADMIKPGSRVLDVGCGDGELLGHLVETKNVDGRGLEISMEGVHASIANGLSVIQGDADTDLAYYPDDTYDYVILSQTLQAMKAPHRTLEELLRIGRRAIVSFPNFGHWRIRSEIFFRGRMPVTDSLPEQWYETPNIHFCTIRDFVVLCEDMDIVIEHSIALNHMGTLRRIHSGKFLSNLLGEQGVFLLRKGG